MKITVELSLYPLKKKYKKPIKKFIRSLKEKKKIGIYTTAMSTYITGDYNKVMKLLQKELKHVFTKNQHVVTVIKIIPQDLAVSKGYLSI